MTKSYHNLNKLLTRIEELKEVIDLEQPYYIPSIWNYKNMGDSELVEINPFEYIAKYIEDQILTQIEPGIDDYSSPLSFFDEKKDWLETGQIFCLDVRTATSWDHNQDNQIVNPGGGITELGTFLKTFFLLPHLQEMGIDILYLLPVLKTGEKYGKGELGSFYAIKNFYKLNPDLHDPILDLPEKPFAVETEFKALIEACHILGIRVIFDFPLRTAARDNDLIREHPEWFYWINLDDLDNYQVPEYSCCDEHVAPTVERLHKIYPLEETQQYVEMFSFPPNEIDKKGWEELLRNFKDDPSQNILDLVEERFGITTAPAYSDWINDPQPSWDDITFLRLYLDEPQVRDGFFKESVPPFLFFDSIKTNIYPGERANQELWKYLNENILYWQKKFGIDGARIDMAHALPEDLEKGIMANSFDFDSSFKFISEELQNSNHTIAKKKGYHSIIGENWWKEARLDVESLVEIIKDLPRLSVPSFACVETPDTPRAAVREGGRDFSRMVGVMNFFLPNTIPFINNGFELYERQPMNLGLDNTEEGRYVLDEDDHYYGRLAFFDPFQLHWLNTGAKRMVQLMKNCQLIRDQYLSLINKPDLLYVTGITGKKLVQYGYRNEEQELICYVNLDNKESWELDEEGQLLISSKFSQDSQQIEPLEFKVYLKK